MNPPTFKPRREGTLVRLFLVAFVVLSFAYQAAVPIFMTDTDMWYHLNAGRYFWNSGGVPDSSFFSFIDPPRTWTNYFWGFQALIYKVYQWLSYHGLVLLRAALFTLTVLTLCLFVFSDRSARARPAAFIVLTVLLVVVLEGRGLALRPHLISYLFILLFIHVLQNRPRWAPVLPPAGLFWINLHGIEWVVGALICGAYLVEHLHSRIGPGRDPRPVDWRYVLSIAAVPLAFLANPHGLRIALAPFETAPDIYLYVNELKPFPFSRLHTVVLSLVEFPIHTAIVLLAAFELAAVAYLAVHRKLRSSHVLIALGGFVLFTKGTRFIWEWALLSLPLIHGFLIERSRSAPRPAFPRAAVGAVAAAYFTVVPLAVLASKPSNYGHYPFEPAGLPVGVTRFLSREQVRGNILSPPSDSGYFQWALYPEILIHSDMEFPPFLPYDNFEAQHAFAQRPVLEKLLDRYGLDFIAVRLKDKGFRKIITEVPDFVPVFFDDAYVLYANRTSNPDLVAEHAIENVDPFNVIGGKGPLEQRIAELQEVGRVYPEGRRINHGLAWLLFSDDQFEHSLEYARKLAEHEPLDPNGPYWIGNNLENMGRCDEAREHYLDAMDIADTTFRKILHTHLGTCAYLSKDFRQAFEHFSKGLNPYLNAMSPEDLYQYAFSAAVAGEIDRAVRLLDMVLLVTDPKDAPIRADARSLKAELRSEDFTDLGVGSWLRSLLD